MNKRIVVWGVVAALAAVAAGLVVVAGGGDGGRDDTASPPRLPLDLAGAQGAAAPGAADALAIGLTPTHYVAADDLPAMGGDGPAYRVQVTAEQVTALAEALGIEGEPAEQDGSWHVEGNGLALDAYGPGGSWSAFPLAAGPDTPQSSPAPPATTAGGGTAGNPGGTTDPTTTDSTIVCITTPCEPAPMSDPPVPATAEATVERPTAPEPVPECPADPGGGSCAPPCEPGPAVTCPADPGVPATTVPATTVLPTDLPPEAEARDLAARLLTAGGFEADEAHIDASPQSGSWSVGFEPTLDGWDAPGLAGVVVLGAGGVESASGYVTPGDPLGDYPLISTGQAIERLNTPGEVTAMAGAGAESSSARSGTDTDTEPANAAPTTGTRPVTASDPAAGTGAGPADGGTIAPPEPQPAPAPEPIEVVLTGVELVYTTVPSWDGSGAYVVPSYRFTGDGGEQVVVSAVADAALRPPPGG